MPQHKNIFKGAALMSGGNQSIATAGLQVVPGVSVSTLTLMGVDLNHWIVVGTFILVLLQIAIALRNLFSRRKDDDEPKRKRSQRGRARLAALGLTAAVTMVAYFEGYRNYGYADPIGIPTACYGTTKGVRIGKFYSNEECERLLGEEFYSAVLSVHRCSPHPLAPHELGALSSAAYNVGPRIVCDTKGSTLARYLQAGDITAACNQLPRWNKAGGVVLPGLIRRREAEQRMCLGLA